MTRKIDKRKKKLEKERNGLFIDDKIISVDRNEKISKGILKKEGSTLSSEIGNIIPKINNNNNFDKDNEKKMKINENDSNNNNDNNITINFKTFLGEGMNSDQAESIPGLGNLGIIKPAWQ